MMDGRSFSSEDSVAAAAPSVLLSILNGSMVGAGASAAGAGAGVVSHDGDDMLYITWMCD